MKVINSEIGCIVLAAGESSRLGHPKALIEVGGETLVSWVSRRLTELGLSPVIVTRNELYQKVKDFADSQDETASKHLDQAIEDYINKLGL